MRENADAITVFKKITFAGRILRRRNMDEVKLLCAVYGEGTLFFVKIARDADVIALQTAIVNEKKGVNDRFKVDPNTVTLYLAKKNGVWLKDDIYVENFLKGDRSVGYLKMRPSWRLTRTELLGPDFQPSEAEIHVLVELPSAAANIATKQGPAQAKGTELVDAISLLVEKRFKSMEEYFRRDVKKMSDREERVASKIQEMSDRAENSRRELKKMIESKIQEINSKLPSQPDKLYTDGALGEIAIESLERFESITDFAARDDEESFWSQRIQRQANAISNEALFDAFITPFFDRALANWNMVFVNSERYLWLTESMNVSRSTDLKPDGFATHPGMYCAKEKPKDKVPRSSNHKFRFGVAEEDLFDCVILFESKLSLTDAAFGQVVRYLQSLCPKTFGSAILYDRRSFWLINSRATFIGKVLKAHWTDGGSKSLFQKFIGANMSPWVASLTTACSSFGVEVVEGDAFLGRGAQGRVFKVTRQGKELFALKIVEISLVASLYQEEAALKQAQDTGLTIRLAGECIEIPGGAALLLSPVGIPLPRPATRSDVATLYGLLWQLHEKGLVHGDPRVANVILHKGQPVWIDLVEVLKASPLLRMFDAEILTRSILQVPRQVQLNTELHETLAKYGKYPTSENLNGLVDAVFQKLDRRSKSFHSH
ncbi:hypothetical protein CCR75_009646 [Bremia lactucae]|uniref:Crinkler effector protein N-terminal domain-containing protein n=1 Tax=Bremia lactucae TaxID=4779 RepID=A0A976IGD8_BRELC|nr:hypothetical protein CCR75_009646 [Bremia lactucae]